MNAELAAHRIASAVAERLHHGPPPDGRDSIYNLVREVAAPILDGLSRCDCAAYHLLDCPEYLTARDEGRRTRLRWNR